MSFLDDKPDLRAYDGVVNLIKVSDTEGGQGASALGKTALQTPLRTKAV